MNNIVKWSVILLMLLLLSSCFGGGGGSDGSGTAPSIDNLNYSPQGAFLNAGGGSITLSGSIDFIDPDGDISNYVLTIVDSGLNVISTLSDPIPGVGGITNATLLLLVQVNTTIVDDYGFSVYLNDSKGNTSNILSGVFPVTGPTATISNIPDTGVDGCYNQTTSIDCPISASDPFYGQDYHYTSNPMSFTNNGDGTITDNVTSLMWQMDHDGFSYNWFEATGTYDATNNPGTTDVCGGLTLGGHTNWRLPEKRELKSIVDYGVVSPSIDATYFPSTGIFNYWTASEYDSTTAWYGQFLDGSIKQGDKTTDMHLRCVRGTPWGNTTFVDNSDGTVTDTISGLMWQITGQGSSYDWEEMLGVCTGLSLAGHTDWRLPDIKELESIVNAEASLDILQGIYCSSSTIADENESVWMIQFHPTSNYGETFQHGAGNSKSTCNSFYSRCVR